jgi:hypothetical protein
VLPKLQRTSRLAVDPHGSPTTSLVFGGRVSAGVQADVFGPGLKKLSLMGSLLTLATSPLK